MKIVKKIYKKKGNGREKFFRRRDKLFFNRIIYF